MLEELVGSTWHRFITHKARKIYPEAAVELQDVRHKMAVFFRALGGEGGLSIESATDFELNSRRTVLQRIAGTGTHTQYAWRDEETLRLPNQIDLFPTKELNTDLYLWLTALSTVETTEQQWIERNQEATQEILTLWPGLKNKYSQLVKAHLEQRPKITEIVKAEAEQEKIIQASLQNSNFKAELSYAKKPPQPVVLWLHPSPPVNEPDFEGALSDPDLPENSNESKPKKTSQKKKKANREEMPEGKDGLMSFRLESLWSWGEYSKVDRTSTEDEDDDTMRTAEDMDTITVAQDGETTASKIKLDLDLPSSQYDDIVLGAGIPMDEWDYKKQVMQKDYCRIIPMVSKDAEAMALPARLRSQAKKIRRQFEILQPNRYWRNRQSDGTEIDLESYVHFLADKTHGAVQTDTPIYKELHQQDRDLSCLVLADLSLSTDSHVNNTSRVIDVIKETLFLFSEALSVTKDRFALYGFSSRTRNHVRFYTLKEFDEKHTDTVRGYIDAARPGYYTRMGAAIRYASTLLEKEGSSQKVLLIITDGKPNDLDKYEGRYGLEDTREAILEAERKGLKPFCVTIDEKAEDYLPYLFGKNAYVVVKSVIELPAKLPLLYLRLTT